MSNIIEQLKSSISTEVLSSVATKLGESESGISKALGATFPALISGFMEKVGESNAQSTIDELMALLKNTVFPEQSQSSDILDFLNDKSSLSGVSKKFLSLIFGDKISEITSFIAKFAGIKNASASSLLSLAGPLLLANLSKKVKTKNLSLSGLSSALLNDKDEIVKSAPTGLASILGLSEISKIGNSVKASLFSEAHKIAEKAEQIETQGICVFKQKCSPFWWISAVLLPLALLLFFWKGCAKQEAELVSQQESGAAQVEQVAKKAQEKINTASTDFNINTNDINTNIDKAEKLLENISDTNTLLESELPNTINTIDAQAAETVPQISSSATDLWGDLGDFSSHLLPNNTELNLPELGVERKLLNFIEDDEKVLDKTSWFSFDRLLFETNSAILKTDSVEQLTNVAGIIKAFPNLKIKIGGYTDNIGHPETNLNLSQNRADAVKADLIKLGISGDRMEAEGYGEQHPIASNQSPEGRTQNRRIDILVTAK